MEGIEKVKANKKIAMTISECAEYSGIGENLLRQLISNNNFDWVFFAGNRIRIKRELFDMWFLNLDRIQ